MSDVSTLHAPSNEASQHPTMIMIGSKTIEQTFILPNECAGQRLDQALAQCQPDYSRACWQRWLKEGMVKVNNTCQTPKYKLKGGEKIDVHATLHIEAAWQPEEIALNIVFEDDDILVINKPAYCVTHPASGNPAGTLANALLHHFPPLATLPRAGLIHRLDKDTTGLLVVAKTLSAYHFLVKELEQRLVKRHYLALVNGNIIAGGTIETPIGRHKKNRIKRAVTQAGKRACTHYRVAERFTCHTLLAVQLETGRTHQIRVHLQHHGYPIVGDQLYGGSIRLPPNPSEAMLEAFSQFKRQALHARRLGFKHPRTKEPVEWTCPLPDDFQALIDVLSVSEPPAE